MTQNCSCHGSGGQYSETVAGSLERPRYSPGLILEDSDLTSAVEYTRALNRMLFRNLLGCGVVCGLMVKAETDCGLEVTVLPGLAIDGCGDPVELPRPVKIKLDKPKLDSLEGKPIDPQKPTAFWVVLCGKEKMCAPRSLVCDSDEFDGVTQPTRIRAQAEVSLAFDNKPECICECQRGEAPPPACDTQGVPDDEVDCHFDHRRRVECAPDCGCGTACACGCCVLLGRVERVKNEQTGEYEWKAIVRNVRRFIRLNVLPDPADREEGWSGYRSTMTVYTGLDDSRMQEGVEYLFKGRKAGDLLSHSEVNQIIAWSAAEDVRRDAANKAEAAAQAAAGSAAPAAAAAPAAKLVAPRGGAARAGRKKPAARAGGTE